MINKSTKNALYAGILIESSFLLSDEEERMKNEIHTSDPKIENEIRGKYKNTILNFQRIRNNAFIMLLRNGNLFYTDSDSWKNCKKLFLSINHQIFELDIQSVKTLLSSDAEKVMDKSFSASKVNNEINLSRADHFNFEDYKDDAKMISINSVKAEKVKSDIEKPVENPDEKLNKKQESRPENTSVSKESRKEIKDQGQEQARTVEVKKEPSEKKIEDKDTKKEIRSIEKDKKPGKKDNKVPLVVADYDMDEFFMDEEDPIIKPRLSNDVTPVKKEDLKEKIAEPKKEEHDEIELIDDTELIKMDGNQNETEGLVESISVEELIMDTYIIKLNNSEDNQEKVFTIIVAPIKNTLKTDAAFAPTFSFVKAGKEFCNGASPNKQRPSYQIGIGGEAFMVRGSWNENGFSSLLYPQNMGEHNMSVTKKQIKPLKVNNIGHNISQMENGIRIHVLPLSSRNGNNGRVSILVCLEDTIEDNYISACTRDASYVDMPYHNRIYRISAKWENKKLVSLIQMI